MEFQILTADEPNLNGRVYPTEVLEKAIAEFNSRTTPMLCEFNASFDVLDLAEVSHQIEKVWLDENRLMANVKVLPTPKGLVLKELVDSNQVAFRPFGTCEAISSDGVVLGYQLLGVAAMHPDTAA